MKIGSPADLPAAAAAHATPSPAADAAKPAVSPNKTTPVTADASATVALSNTAATLLSSGAPAEFDAAKVDAISGAIAAGTFKVNPEAIADKLIANAQELLTKVKG